MKNSEVNLDRVLGSPMVHPKSRYSHLTELYYILCIVVIVVISLFTVWGRGGYLQMIKARSDLETQRVRVESLKRSNSERLKSIEGLRSDPATLERHARQKGYARKGDLVYQTPEEPKPKTEGSKP